MCRLLTSRVRTLIVNDPDADVESPTGLVRFPEKHPNAMNQRVWHPRNNLCGVQSLRMVTSAASGSAKR